MTSAGEISYTVRKSTLANAGDRLTIKGIYVPDPSLATEHVEWASVDDDDFEIDGATGEVTLDSPSNRRIRAYYKYSRFSDAELNDALGRGASVLEAAVIILEALQFAAGTHFQWRAPDGTSVNDTGAQAHYRDMYKVFKAQLTEEAIDGGIIASWGEGQAGL